MFETFADQWARDLFYCNHDFSVFSAHRTEGMMTWSEIKKERFNGYDVDPKTFVVMRTTAPAYNWKDLSRALVSKDWTREEDAKINDEIKAYGGLLLDGEWVPKVAFASFPRCGNTMTRKYFQEFTGVLSGSVMRNQIPGCITLEI